MAHAKKRALKYPLQVLRSVRREREREKKIKVLIKHVVHNKFWSQAKKGRHSIQNQNENKFEEKKKKKENK